MNSLEKQRLRASMSPENFEKQEERRRLLLSSRWYYKPIDERGINVPMNLRFYAQDMYDDIPLCNREKHEDSSVATSGSGLLVARFCAKYYQCHKQLKIEELADIAIELGYISYSRQANGMWNENNGISTEFFDKFVPRFYGLFSHRIRDINEVRDAILNKDLVICRVKDFLNRISVTSKKSHYITIVGDDKQGFFVYDPIYSSIQHMGHNKVFKAFEDAWVLYKI